MAKTKEKINYIVLGLILVVTLGIYWPSLKNELTNWDDQEYITNNKNLSETSFRKHFKEVPHVMGNYHPLSMWTLSLDYQAAYDKETKKIDPLPFHRTNLILHVLSAALVFFIFFRLTGNNLIAGITTALFALHPMHVESVAWAAERKDVLYAFFYLAAILAWVYYVKKSKSYTFYGIALALFILSLFSKAVAVTLPVLLIAIDYFMQRKFTRKIIAEKIPFIALSVYFGLRAIDAQKEFEAIQGNEIYNLADKLLFASYGTMQYFVKFMVPTNLSCFYTFPIPGIDKPSLYYFAPMFVIGLGAGVYFLRKNRAVLFGTAFFFITVGLVLQLLPVGGAVMADRYSYLPHIGLGFLLAIGIQYLIDKNPGQKNMYLGGIIAFCISMTILAFNRTKIWSDSVTLWTDAESKEKMSPKIYNNFGDALTLALRYEEGLAMYDKAIELKPDYPDAFYNRGLSYFYMKKYQESINDYTKAIEISPKLSRAWHNRAGTYFTVGMYKEALADAKKARELGYPVDPGFIKVLEEEVVKKSVTPIK